MLLEGWGLDGNAQESCGWDILCWIEETQERSFKLYQMKKRGKLLNYPRKIGWTTKVTCYQLWQRRFFNTLLPIKVTAAANWSDLGYDKCSTKSQYDGLLQLRHYCMQLITLFPCTYIFHQLSNIFSSCIFIAAKKRFEAQNR